MTEKVGIEGKKIDKSCEVIRKAREKFHKEKHGQIKG
jgi:hypothetical protein